MTEPFNPVATAELADPYPVYRAYREAGAVHRSAFGEWYVFRHAEGLRVLHGEPFVRDMRNAVAHEHAEQPPERHAAWTEFNQKAMLFRDPPDHTRLRSLVSRAFTPRMTEGLRPRVQQIVDELLDAAESTGPFDVIAALALPLPLLVIAELLGVPGADRAQLKRWSSAIFKGIDIVPPDEQDAALSAASIATVEFGAYLRALAAERRRVPREDLLSALVRIEEQGERLAEDELVHMCILLLGAGHETTTNLLGNGVLALLRHPVQLALLRRDGTLLESAVDELLRYDSPVQMVGRWAAANTALGGVAIPRGAMLIVLAGAANRDPAVFAEPERLDVTRRDRRALSFGHGPHYCLGAPLARVEGQIALGSLLRRFPRLALAEEEPRWNGSPVFRGLRELWLEPGG
jgi:pimeloyl-[acyl-carrier protein] synthase